MKHAVLIALLLCAACGGKLDTGDGGPPEPGPDGSPVSKDAQPATDTGTGTDTGTTHGCSSVATAEMMDSNGGCQISESWSCGATSYAVQCNCPMGVCTCSEQTAMMGSGTMVSAGGICPACGSSGLAAVCGYPQ